MDRPAYAVEPERCDAGHDRLARAALRALLGSAAPDELARRARAAGLVVGRVYTPLVARGGDDANLELVRSLRAAGVFVVQEAGAVVGLVQADGDERALARCGAAFALAPDTPRERLGDALKGLRQLVDVAARLGLRRRSGEREFLLERSLLNSPVLDDTLERLVVRAACRARRGARQRSHPHAARVRRQRAATQGGRPRAAHPPQHARFAPGADRGADGSGSRRPGRPRAGDRRDLAPGGRRQPAPTSARRSMVCGGSRCRAPKSGTSPIEGGHSADYPCRPTCCRAAAIDGSC